MKQLGDWKSLVNTDFPERGEVTEGTRTEALRRFRQIRCSMRVATGRVHVDAEYEDWRQRVLATPLP